MRLSRDEAREVAVTALLLAIVFRVLAGVFQAVEELGRENTWRSVLGRFLAPLGSSLGLLAIGVALLVALSPTGSVSGRLSLLTQRVLGVVALFGAVAVLNGLTSDFVVLPAAFGSR